MKAQAAKPAAKAARKEPALAAALPMVTPLGFDHVVLQRKACACGGDCPRCKNKPSLQTKLAVSRPGDAFEREADAVAERVLRMPAPNAAPALDGNYARAGPQLSRLETSSASPRLHDVPAVVHDTLRSPGQPLDAATRGFFEPRFGVDFSGVRVHTNARSAQSAQAVGAHAYAVGRNLVFNDGQYSPNSTAGRRLIAHELTHVVQQAGGGGGLLAAPRTIQRYGQKDSCPQSFLESHIWPGVDLTRKMLVHVLNSLCAALYGNPTKRNKEAIIQFKVIFGVDWKTKTQELYNNLWLLRAALDGDFMFDCVKGCDSGPSGTEWGKTWVKTWAWGGPGATIKLCHENLVTQDLPWFAMVLIHELAHAMLGLEHGSDNESGTCDGETNDAQCYGLIAKDVWKNVDPEYGTKIGDLCLGGGSGATQNPTNWD